jgi:autotransporter-associated beta strand protein
MSKNYFNSNMALEKNNRGLFAFILAALISTNAYNAQAVVYLWNNTGTNWTSASSWTNGVAPSATSSSTGTDEVQFGNFGVNNNTVVLTSSRDAQNITFVAGANAYNINSFNGTQLLSTRLGMTNNSTATQTFGIVINNANANNTWTQVAGGSMVFNNNVGLTTAASSATRTLTLTGGGTFTFNAGITQGLSTTSKLAVNNAGGVVNLNAANLGGITITSGQVNFRNAGALGNGIVELGANTGSSYGSSILNNATGSAVTLTGLTGVIWSGSITSGNTGIQFGTSASTSANNIDFGTGFVTAASDRSMNIAGTGVTISMGTLTASGTAGSYTYKIDGVGNTLDLDGWRISGAATPTQAVQHKISGTANVNIGTIENGTGAFANSAVFMTDGTTRLTGNNTYTGTTDFVGSGTNIISGNNSAAVGNVKIAGDTGKTPVVRLENINAISSSSSLLGASGTAQIGTLDLRAAGNFSLNSFGTVGAAGNNMIFTNSSGSQKTLAFTAANNYITTATTGGRTLYNNSADLLLDFDGNIEIGGTSAAGEATTFAGVGNFNVDGNLTDTGTGEARTLRKTGDGTLTLRGSANNIRGSTLLERGELDLYGSVTASTNIVVSTSGAVSGTSTTRTATATLDVKSGGSLLNNSTTTVYSGGNLIVNGTAGAVVMESNGLLGGSGTVGAVTLKSGSLLTPGNSPGTLTAASSSWAAGSTYEWQIDNAAGTAGINWDLFSVVGALDLSALSSTAQMNLVLESLSIANFSTTSSYTWVIAQAGSFIGTGLADGTDVTSLFNINTADFNGGSAANLPNGGFQVVTGTEGSLRTLNLMAIPEPSTGSMLGLGLAGLVVTRLLRRKNS